MELMQNFRQYKTVPSLTRDDNVIPQASEIPALLNSFSHPRRRSISVGPQSQADAYEAMAMRDQARRQSSSTTSRPPSCEISPSGDIFRYQKTSKSSDVRFTSFEDHNRTARSNQQSIMNKCDRSSNTEDLQNGSSEVLMDECETDHGNNRIFSVLHKPRVRYDVEVITKLIVYSGKDLVASQACNLVADI